MGIQSATATETATAVRGALTGMNIQEVQHSPGCAWQQSQGHLQKAVSPGQPTCQLPPTPDTDRSCLQLPNKPLKGS